MSLTPLKDIIRLKPRPETTLALETAIRAGAETVKSYRFTPSLRDYFREMLELAVSNRGQGYWIQAEYGAGKTHFLGTIGALLTNGTGDVWDAVTDPEIREFRTALTGKTRLFPVILNCKGRLATEGGERERARAASDLTAFCTDPNEAEKALREFSTFHEEYRARYQQHYRDYRDRVAALNVQLRTLESQIQGLVYMDSVRDLGMPVGSRLTNEYNDLLERTETSHLQEGLPDVDKRPFVGGVRLDTEPPTAEVSRLKSDLEMALLRRLELLSTPAIRDLLSASAEGDVQDLVVAVDEGNPTRVATVFTAHVADKVKALLRSARMVVVDVPLADYGPVQVGDSGDDLAQAVQRFERFLKQRLDAARNLHPGKIVRLNLK